MTCEPCHTSNEQYETPRSEYGLAKRDLAHPKKSNKSLNEVSGINEAILANDLSHLLYNSKQEP